jgi:hypothetical protein
MRERFARLRAVGVDDHGGLTGWGWEQDALARRELGLDEAAQEIRAAVVERACPA